jgi:hypothetical protein
MTPPSRAGIPKWWDAPTVGWRVGAWGRWSAPRPGMVRVLACRKELQSDVDEAIAARSSGAPNAVRRLSLRGADLRSRGLACLTGSRHDRRRRRAARASRGRPSGRLQPACNVITGFRPASPSSASTIWRWLHEDATKPRQTCSWIFLRDPRFVEKAGRVLSRRALGVLPLPYQPVSCASAAAACCHPANVCEARRTRSTSASWSSAQPERTDVPGNGC